MAGENEVREVCEGEEGKGELGGEGSERVLSLDDSGVDDREVRVRRSMPAGNAARGGIARGNMRGSRVATMPSKMYRSTDSRSPKYSQWRIEGNDAG